MRSSPNVKSGRQYRRERPVTAPPHCKQPAAWSIRRASLSPGPRIFRKHPGPGCRHVLTKGDVCKFISILPDWPALSFGLKTILIAPARRNCDGYHRPGLVAICAQSVNLSQLVPYEAYIREHRDIFKRLGVPIERTKDGHLLHFTAATLRAYQLLHIFLHELGHHHDRMTTRSQVRPSRGEGFAERYARSNGDRVWARYFEVFPVAPTIL
jgi:hypothetical protein